MTDPRARWQTKSLIRDFARTWTKVAGGIATGLLSWVVGLLFGVQPIPGTVPFANMVHEHPEAVVAGAAAVFLTTVVAWALARQAELEAKHGRRRETDPAGKAHPSLLVISTAVATFSTCAWVATIALVLAQPQWCPSALCVQPPGPHDQYLESELTTLESATYVIPGEPTGYSLGRLPATSGPAAVVAQQIGPSTSVASGPYRVIIRIHDLQRGGTGMFIEAVSLQLRRVRPAPNPLRVWLRGTPLDYQANPFRAEYTGQPAGSALFATYVGQVREGHVQLAPGESDELAINLVATVPVDLSFQLRITYRIASELRVRLLTLPYVFEAVFSAAPDWQQYRLQDGRFVPS